MYTDKDKSENISIMELTPDEAKNLGTILLEFERLVDKSHFLSDTKQGELTIVFH